MKLSIPAEQESDAIQRQEGLLAERASRDRQAFAILYDRYFNRIYNYLRFRCSDPETADDLAAQVFERALANINSYRPDTAPFGAWLFAIARNALNDHLRAQQRWSWLPIDGLRRIAGHGPGPEESLVTQETQDELLSALEKLSQRERDLIALKFVGGLNNRQIAGMSGLSESNVGVILYRSMHRLREMMKGQASGFEENEEQYGRP